MNKNKRQYSLKIIIAWGMALIAILLFGLCMCFAVSTWRRLAEHEKTIYTESLELQVSIAENEFQRLQNDLLSITVTETPYILLKEIESGSPYNFQRLQLAAALRQMLEGYSYINGLFLFDTDQQKDLIQYDSTEDYDSADLVRQALIREIEANQGEIPKQKNTLMEISGSWYYLYQMSDEDMILGGWCDLTSILEFMKSIQPVCGYEMSLDGTALRSKMSEKDVFDVYTTGKISGAEYRIFFSRSALHQLVFQTMSGDVVIAVIGITLMLTVLLGIRRMVLNPVKYMEKNVWKISEGNLKVRLSNRNHPREYQMLYHSFNQMLDQIEKLKIRVYEEQMEKQKTQMAYLAMQTNPHFYVNSLNVIHNLAEMKNYPLIERMTQCLSGYFNYMFRTDMDTVALGDELRNLSNYLDIQKIRYAEKIEVKMDVQPECLDARSPILLVHTFAENSMKYSGIDLGSLVMSLTIYKETDGDHIRMIWEDNGVGFSDDMLEKLNRREKIVKPDGEHIGISNLLKRAEIFYSGDFAALFGNRKRGGAWIQLEIPYIPLYTDAKIR